MPEIINLSGETYTEPSKRKFLPLPVGTYPVTVFDVKKGVYKSVANKDRPNYNVQLKVLDEAPEGKNRRIFTTIPLFLSWNPKDGEEEGADAFAFYDFFGPILGKTSKEFRAEVKEAIKNGKNLSIPTPTELMGKRLLIKLKISDDTYAFNKAEAQAKADGEEFTETQADYRKNEIESYALYTAGGGGAKPSLDDFKL